MLLVSSMRCQCLALVLSSLVALATSADQKLVIILLDGFRWDYADRMGRQEVPNFRRLIAESGVRAEYVQPIYPSNSFPSWTTITSGANTRIYCTYCT